MIADQAKTVGQGSIPLTVNTAGNWPINIHFHREAVVLHAAQQRQGEEKQPRFWIG